MGKVMSRVFGTSAGVASALLVALAIQAPASAGTASAVAFTGPAGTQYAAVGGAATEQSEPIAVAPLAVHRKSASCVSPSGSKFNISYGDGIASTTFYFNNHCNQKRRIVIRTHYDELVSCIEVNAGTQGRKKIGFPTHQIGSVTLPRTACPSS
ncbi:hypothetical protein Misp01_47670 [Microtetraspora sp. NBRC 13810]|uniref:hypothetical protein n=1 Tax=Microtetraspora sp. NBRC 13810 TaxID=3030990 RepID=UPI0024A2AF23|nr:hypothetical protein [Microtetraspora sp. NBRC 13810]GLW09638.1 hypothetical protein Misp01_47670 [Microtetraspora sp. NBRC 13810]